MCVRVSVLFGFEGRMWDLIILVPDHFLSVYFDSGPGTCSNSIILISAILFMRRKIPYCVQLSSCPYRFVLKNKTKQWLTGVGDRLLAGKQT